MAVSDWSTTAANNNAAPPNGAPEGWAPSAVNDTVRQIMADVRSFYDNTALKNASNSFTGSYPQLILSASSPGLSLRESDAAADNGRWDFGPSAESLVFQAVNDAANSFVTWLQVDRTGTVIDSISLQSGSVGINGAQFLTGYISPSALASGNTNDYAPTGFSTARVLRLSPNASGSTLTGLAGGVDGRVVTIINISAANLLTLAAENASSSAANRFGLVSANSINAGFGTTLWYDGTSSRWRIMF